MHERNGSLSAVAAMTIERAEMWKTYVFHGQAVVVVQQWHDPFGRPMLRIESTDPDDDRGDGISEEQFLSSARPIDDQQ